MENKEKSGRDLLTLVLVAGAGPAGLEAACVLSERGHRVQLYEQSSEAGGTFLLASNPPFKQGILEVIRYRMNRLRDLGVEVFLICSALVGTVAQRILRRICPHCQEPYEPPIEERMAYQEEMGELPAQFYKGAGCHFCANTGYLGRCGIYEVLTLTEEVKQLFISGSSAAQIRAQALKGGMVSLAHDGMLKVKEGMTTVPEVLRNVFSIKY